MRKFFILDFETNGLSFHDMEIIQCAILVVNEYMKIEDVFNKYYLAHNLKNSAEITGLTHEFLSKKSNDYFGKEDLTEIINITEQGVIVGQNINFDLMVYDVMCLKHHIPIVPKYPLDIIEQFAVNGQYVSLEYTAKQNLSQEQFKNIENISGNTGFHDALYDVATVYELIRKNPQFKSRLNNYMYSLPVPEVYSL